MTENRTKERLLLMDGVKLLAAFFVVFIHCRFYGNFGVAVKAVARFAVPFFFLCSGYFLYNNDPARIRKKLFHILQLYLVGLLLYFAFKAARLFVGDANGAIIDDFRSILSVDAFLKWLVFNEHVQGGHFWYLHAVIYVYLIHYFIAWKKIPEKFVYVSSVVLLGLHLIIWQVILTFGQPAMARDTFLVRNFLFDAYPIISLGMLVRKYRHKIPDMKGSELLLVVAAGVVLSIVSRWLLGDKSVPLGALLIAYALIIYTTQPHPKAKPWMSKAGACSTYVYILHPMVIAATRVIAARSGISTDSLLWINLHPLITCLFSAVAAWVIVTFTQRIKMRFARHTS